MCVRMYLCACQSMVWGVHIQWPRTWVHVYACVCVCVCVCMCMYVNCGCGLDTSGCAQNQMMSTDEGVTWHASVYVCKCAHVYPFVNKSISTHTDKQEHIYTYRLAIQKLVDNPPRPPSGKITYMHTQIAVQRIWAIFCTFWWAHGVDVPLHGAVQKDCGSLLPNVAARAVEFAKIRFFFMLWNQAEKSA